MEINKTDSSTLVERVIVMLVLTSLCVAINTAYVVHLDGGKTLPEYVGIFLGGLIFVPLISFILSSIVFLFAFIAFGATGRKSLHQIWLVATYFLNVVFYFVVIYVLCENEIWLVIWDHQRDKEFSFVIDLLALSMPALFFYLSSFVLTEELYMKKKMEYQNISSNKK